MITYGMHLSAVGMEPLLSPAMSAPAFSETTLSRCATDKGNDNVSRPATFVFLLRHLYRFSRLGSVISLALVTVD
jgi:hypothetical protein